MNIYAYARNSWLVWIVWFKIIVFQRCDQTYHLNRFFLYCSTSAQTSYSALSFGAHPSVTRQRWAEISKTDYAIIVLSQLLFLWSTTNSDAFRDFCSRAREKCVKKFPWSKRAFFTSLIGHSCFTSSQLVFYVRIYLTYFMFIKKEYCNRFFAHLHII